MFRLGKQVRRHITGIGRLVRNDQNLTGTGDGIYTDIAEAGLLRKRNEDIAGACDLIYLRDTLRTESHSSDGLRPADLIDLIHARDAGRRQCTRIHFSVRPRRCRHDDLLHARHLRRDHIHQHAARIGRLAARHIDTGYGERQDPLSENAAVRLRVDPAVAELFLVKRLDVGGGFLHNRKERPVDGFDGLLDLCLRHTDVIGMTLPLIKLLRVGKYRPVTVCPHIGYDVRYCLLIFRIIIRASF